MKRTTRHLWHLQLAITMLLLFLTVTAKPNATFTAQVGCNGYVTFTANQQTYNTYTWAFGDNTSGSGPSVVHQYAPGSYTVTLTEQDAIDSVFSVQQVSIGIYIQQQLTGSSDVCNGTTAIYHLTNATDSLQYSWLVSGADMLSDSHADSANLSFSDTGAAVLSVIVSNGHGCDSILVQHIQVHPVPHLIIPGHTNDTAQFQLSYCQNTPVWYHVLTNTPGNIVWSSGSGTTLSAQGTDSMLFVFHNAGTTYINVVETTPTGCTDSVQVLVVVSAAPSITATGTNACLGTDNTFVAVSAPPGASLTYNWIFDDGAIGAVNPAAHTFANTGQHTAVVIATNGSGCADTANANVQVDAHPGPDIVCVGPVCAGQHETYSTTAVAGVSYHWTVTGGTVTAGGTLNDNTVAVTWGNGPVGNISLYLTGPGTYCQYPTSTDVQILGGTWAIQGNTTPCGYQTTTYSTPVVPGGVYNWTIANGYIQNGQGTNRVQVYWYYTTLPTSITVNVTHQILSCSSSVTLNITPAGSFSLYAPLACVGIPATINTYVTGNFNWTVQGGTIVSGNPGNSIQAVWQSPGSYHVTAHIASGFCNTDADAYVNVIERKQETVTGPNKACSTSTETYSISPLERNITWSVLHNTGLVEAGANSNAANVYWLTPGADTLMVIYSNSNGCTDTSFYTVNVAPAGAPNFTGDTVVCYGDSKTYTFTPYAGVDYVWEAEGGQITAGQNTGTVTVLWNGVQEGMLRLRNKVCNSFAQKAIVIRPTPQVHFKTENLTCDGSSADIKVVEEYPWYTWDNALTTQSIHITVAGAYTVTVADVLGCSASATENANPIPSNGITNAYINAVVPSVPIPYAYLQLYALGNTVPGTYLWSTGNTANEQDVTTTGTYTVTMTNSYGCTAVVSAVVTSTAGSCTCNGGTCTAATVLLPCPGITPVYTTNNPVCNPVEFTPGVVATYYHWNFNDGLFSTSANPTHRFSSAGTKTVELSYSNDGTNWYQCSQTMVINSVMDPEFTTSLACKGNITFTNTSTSVLAVNAVTWRLGDGNISSSTPTLTYQYPNNAGQYQVSLILDDGTCVDSVQRWVNVNELVAGFTYRNACTENAAQFNDGTIHTDLISSYSWDFGNGETEDYYDPVTYFHTAGSYTVTLTVKDADGCIDNTSQTVVVNPFNQLPITASGPLTFCKGASVNLSLPPNYSYYWNTSDTAQSIHVTTSGSYYAWVQDPVTGCSGFTDTDRVQENIPPRAYAYAYPDGQTTLCEGTTLNLLSYPTGMSQYQWYVNGVAGSANSSLYYYYVTTAQSGTYQMVITDNNGCKDTSDALQVVINANPAYPSVTESPSTSHCAGDVVTLTVAGNDFYQWTNNVTGNTNTVTTDGEYDVVATNNYGCAVRTYHYVSMQPLPDMSLFPTGCYQICQNQNVTVHGPLGMQSYLWSTGETTASVTLSNSGTYSLSVTSASGCTNQSGSFNVDVFGSDNINLGADTVLCHASSLVLDAGAYPTVTWQDNSHNQTYTVTDSGLYYVQVVNDAGCTSSDSIRVDIFNLNVNLGNDTALCSAQTLVLDAGNYPSITWQDNSHNQTYTVTDSGLYYVQVSNGFCTASDSIRVTSFSSAVNLGNDTLLCGAQSLVLDAGSFLSITWQDNSHNQTYTVTDSGWYYVQVSNGICSATDSIHVDVFNASINLGNDTVICSSDSLLLNVSGAFTSVVWQDNTTGPLYTVRQAGLYYAIATAANGCTAADSVVVTNFPVTQVTLPQSLHVCSSPLVLTVGGAFNTYLWNTGSTASALSVADTGTYAVTVTDANGCSGTASTNVLPCDSDNHSACSGQYIMPNAFTPNNDGNNDLFMALKRPNCVPSNSFSLTIFNRWGQVLYQTFNENSGWDGRYAGSDEPPGVLIYTLKYGCPEGGVTVEGSLTLLR